MEFSRVKKGTVAPGSGDSVVADWKAASAPPVTCGSPQARSATSLSRSAAVSRSLVATLKVADLVYDPAGGRWSVRSASATVK